MESSDETPSPTQDIFPEMMKSRKSNLEKEKNTLDVNNETVKKTGSLSKMKKNNVLMKGVKYSEVSEPNEKSSEEKIDNFEEEIGKNDMSDNGNKLNLLYEEVKESARKLENVVGGNLMKTESNEKLFEENDMKVSEWEGRRSVSKRKFDDQQKKQSSSLSPVVDRVEFSTELTELEKQNYESMNKTWNDLKDKIQEERKKAEEKIRELSKSNGLPNISDSHSSDSEPENFSNPPSFFDVPGFNLDDKKELKYVNFTDNAYILKELEKTDKVFNKLKNDTKKYTHQRANTPAVGVGEKKNKTNSKLKSSTPKPKPRQQDVKTFRTESRRDPKFLEEFQSEYQKQNLIKALKAIDDERDPSYSTEESGDSEPDSKNDKTYVKNSFKSSHKDLIHKNNDDFLTELFGSKKKLGKNENIKFESLTEINE